MFEPLDKDQHQNYVSREGPTGNFEEPAVEEPQQAGTVEAPTCTTAAEIKTRKLPVKRKKDTVVKETQAEGESHADETVVPKKEEQLPLREKLLTS